MVLDNNAILVAFVFTNVISNSIFAPIAPAGTMEDIMVAHPGIVPLPIILPTQGQTQIKTKNRLANLNQNPYRSTFIQMTRIRS